MASLPTMSVNVSSTTRTTTRISPATADLAAVAYGTHQARCCRHGLALALAGVTAVAAGCGFDFDPASRVADRRIIALQADTPELHGHVPPEVTVSALVVEPGGAAPEVDYVWRLCQVAPLGNVPGGPRFLNVDEHGLCDAEAPETLLAQGRARLNALHTSAPVPNELRTLLAAAANGLPVSPIAPQLQIQLEVHLPEPAPPGGTGSEGKSPAPEASWLFATKRIAVSPMLPEGQEVNTNPLLTGLVFDGEPWTAGEPIVIERDACPDTERVSQLSDDPKAPRVCRHEVVPLFGPSQSQVYELDQQGVDGLERIQTTERLRFSWFADGGSFESTNTSQPDPLVGISFGGDDVANGWLEPPEAVDRVVFWVVVRDRRGGTSWERREVVFAP